MSPATLSHGVDVLQFLHSDWQTVSALASEICAPDPEVADAARAQAEDDMSLLLVRLCARLYALSRIETELLYPCLPDPHVREAGSRLHDQMVVDLHAVLDAMVGQDDIDPRVHVLARDMVALHQFEMDVVYPRCSVDSLKGIGERLVRRRIELLDSFTETSEA